MRNKEQAMSVVNDILSILEGDDMTMLRGDLEMEVNESGNKMLEKKFYGADNVLDTAIALLKGLRGSISRA